MTDLSDLAAVVPEVAEYAEIRRWTGGSCINAHLADAALVATVAYYEERLLERERCGSCKHWFSVWHCRRDRRLTLRRDTHCPTDQWELCDMPITPDHPHGRFEPMGGA